MKSTVKKIAIVPLIFTLLLTTFNTVVAQEENQPTFIPLPARPSDLQTGEDDEALDSEESSQEDSSSTDEEDVEDSEEEETEGLYSNNMILYSAMSFPSEATRTEFVEYLNENEDTKNKYRLESVDQDDQILLFVNYTDEATTNDLPIILYLPLENAGEEDAEEVMEYNMLIYPDLFFTAELVENDQSFDIAFGIRHTADAQAFWYDEDNPKIYYEEPRDEFTFDIDEDQEELYKNSIEEAFPNQFEFTSSRTEDGLIELTMNQKDVEVDDQSTVDEDQTLSSIQPSRFSRINNWFNRQMDRMNMSALLTRFNLTESNITTATYIIVGAIFLIGLLIIVIGRR